MPLFEIGDIVEILTLDELFNKYGGNSPDIETLQIPHGFNEGMADCCGHTYRVCDTDNHHGLDRRSYNLETIENTSPPRMSRWSWTEGALKRAKPPHPDVFQQLFPAEEE